MTEKNNQQLQTINNSDFDQMANQKWAKSATDIKIFLKIILTCLIIIILLQSYIILNQKKVEIIWRTPTKPVTFIWLGKKPLSSKYTNRLKDANIKTNFLNDQDWKILGWSWQKYPSLKFIEKADILRLIYVYNYGGIYSDFDTICDYDQIFLNLPTQKGCYFAGHWQIPVYPDGINNSWIYCTDPYNQGVKQVLDSIRKNIQQRQRTGIDKGVLYTTGPDELRQHPTLKALPRYYTYCYHETDSTWRQ